MKKPPHRRYSAQVAAEYLVIAAVVLIIAIIVVYVIGGFTLQAPEQREKLGQAAWSGAQPIGVSGIVWQGSSMTFYVKNNGLEKVKITFMRFSPYAAASMNITLNPQEERRIAFGVWPSCAGTGRIFEFRDFRFVYEKEYIKNITQRVNVPYVGRCK